MAKHVKRRSLVGEGLPLGTEAIPATTEGVHKVRGFLNDRSKRDRSCFYGVMSWVSDVSAGSQDFRIL